MFCGTSGIPGCGSDVTTCHSKRRDDVISIYGELPLHTNSSCADIACGGVSITCGGRSRQEQGQDEWVGEEEKEGELRVLVIGPPGVGKSALCARLLNSKARKQGHPSASQECSKRCMDFRGEVDGDSVLLKLKEISTTFPMRTSMVGSCIDLRGLARCCGGVVAVYSVTERPSMGTVCRLVTYLRHVRGHTELPFVLVGNKIDLLSSRCVSRSEGQSLAFDLGVAFYETSAHLSYHTILQVFDDIVRQGRSVKLRLEYVKQQHLLSPTTHRRSRFTNNIFERLRSMKCKLTNTQVLESSGQVTYTSQSGTENNKEQLLKHAQNNIDNVTIEKT